jgi:hypothetical protein
MRGTSQTHPDWQPVLTFVRAFLPRPDSHGSGQGGESIARSVLVTSLPEPMFPPGVRIGSTAATN